MDRNAAPPRSGRFRDTQLYLRLLGYVRPHWLFFLLSFLGYLVYSAGVVLLADLMQFLFDALGEAGAADAGILSGMAYGLFSVPGEQRLDFSRVAVPALLVAITLLRALGFFAGSYCMSHVARHLVHDLRCQLFDRMLTAPARYFDQHSRGLLVSRVTFNVEQVSEAATKALKTLLRESLVVVGLVGYMLYLNWQLSLVFLLVTPAITLVVNVVGRHFRRYSRRIQNSMGEVTQVTQESVSGWREIRLYGGDAERRERFTKASAYNRQQNLKMAFADAISTPVIQTLLALALAVLVWFALSPAVLAQLTAGSLVAFLVAAIQLGKPLRQLSAVQSVVQRGLAGAEDIFLQLDQPAETDTGTYAPERTRGRIELRGLTFVWPGTGQPALSAIDLQIEPGETLALVGPSGAGKTTLVSLLARLADPPIGSVLLDGVPVEDYSLKALRRQIAVVSQNAPLFRGTVMDNIAYGGLHGLGEDAVAAAAEAACAMEFIEALPGGLQARLTDDGSDLSGGQRQRIAIARAILKDAPVLILDEATSALDNASEFRVQQALETVMRGRTTLVIAHRLSTVEKADRIAVLDGGKVVAIGTHAQLLASGGLYAALHQRQFKD